MDSRRFEVLNLYVEKKLCTNINGHGIDHIMRVYNLTKQLVKSFPKANEELCYVASLVHDIIDDKVVNNVELEEKQLDEFLSSLEYCKSFRRDVFFIIKNMSYSKQKKGIFSDMVEGQIVQDADRLDAIGAVGVARAFMYGGSKGNAIYDEGDYTNQSIIGHFHMKLYKIFDELNTEPAKQIATTRIEFMRLFETEIIGEIKGEF